LIAVHVEARRKTTQDEASVQTTVSGADACQYSHMTSNNCHGEAQPPPRRVVASLTDDVADKR
jgi:hypothetical protein